jgi:hypothetical protein
MNDKRILCLPESHSCRGYILARDHYRSDADFLGGLTIEALKDFPKLDVKTVQTFMVTASRYNLGFWGIVFPLPAGSEHAAYQPVNCLDFRATCTSPVNA